MIGRNAASPPIRHGYDPAVLHAGEVEHLNYDVEIIKTSIPNLKYGETPGYGYGPVYGMTPTTAVDPYIQYKSISDSPDDKYWARPYIGEEHIISRYESNGLFERPQWKRLAVHSLTCACVYPVVRLICLLANHRSIFWARFIVGVGSGVLGVALSLNLLEFAKRHLEASSE